VWSKTRRRSCRKAQVAVCAHEVRHSSTRTRHRQAHVNSNHGQTARSRHQNLRVDSEDASEPVRRRLGHQRGLETVQCLHNVRGHDWLVDWRWGIHVERGPRAAAAYWETGETQVCGRFAGIRERHHPGPGQTGKRILKDEKLGWEFNWHRVLSLMKRYPEKAVYKVLQTMIRRGEVQHRAQRKLLFRIR